jgi:uncharacterized protein (DUF427 family)
MLKAIWNGAVLAQSTAFKTVEGHVYFPREALNWQCLTESSTRIHCPRKGVARHLHVVVDGEVNADAGWYFPEPKPAARSIAGHVAFWRGVKIER